MIICGLRHGTRSKNGIASCFDIIAHTLDRFPARQPINDAVLQTVMFWRDLFTKYWLESTLTIMNSKKLEFIIYYFYGLIPQDTGTLDSTLIKIATIMMQIIIQGM